VVPSSLYRLAGVADFVSHPSLTSLGSSHFAKSTFIQHRFSLLRCFQRHVTHALTISPSPLFLFIEVRLSHLDSLCLIPTTFLLSPTFSLITCVFILVVLLPLASEDGPIRSFPPFIQLFRSATRFLLVRRLS